MRIVFEKLTEKAGITTNQLAKELSLAGFYKNVHSAETVIYNHINGKSKHPVSWDLLKWLALRFECKGADLIQWDDNIK